MNSLALYLACLFFWLAGGLAGLISKNRAAALAAILAAAGSAFGIAAAAQAIGGGAIVIRAAWQIPYGEFHLMLDSLSAIFLIPILFLSAAASVYGIGYLREKTAAKLGLSIFFYHVLVVSMCVVVCARNAVLFLTAWEVMALSSFFLVLHDAGRAEVRGAGWMYLVATHIGTAFILVLFAWMGHAAGSMDFDRWMELPAGAAGISAAWFIFALIGFGTKAGFWPLHVWLPEAHPAAPSHVSAVMSGVMIKTGIYGLIRMLTFLGPPPVWWGLAILGVGIVSGILGVLFALAQHDLKRLLAYHSVENIGIIAIGLGAALIGMSFGMKEVAVLGLAGAFLHVTNHALFKGLLFLGAGSVAHATGTRDIESLGGLMKKMPVTGTTFMIGSAAISGLPPFNGFVSEFFIYTACFKLALSGAWGGAIGGSAIAALALIGGLAAACFTKAFGVIFLGEPRQSHRGAESPLSMSLSMIFLAATCVLIGIFPFAVVPCLSSAVARAAGMEPELVRGIMLTVSALLARIAAIVWALIGLIAGFAVLRKILLSGRTVSSSGTWDCGFSKPAPRMQYTASSFVQPLTDLFRILLLPKEHRVSPKGHFPAEASYESHTPDLATSRFFKPLFEWIHSISTKCHWIQHGWIQGYLLYIFSTLAILLIWALGR